MTAMDDHDDDHGHDHDDDHGDDHGHDHDGDGGHDEDPAAFWEARYAGGQQWSGRPNALLVDAVGDLAPGTALDLGCGEGGDAIWLARRGWRVTAVDIAEGALALGARHAAEAGVADAITWERHDLADSWPDGTFDVVSACYLHSPVALPRGEVLRRAAAAVAPGGHLVVVGHAGAPSWAPPDHPHHTHEFPSPTDVLADLALEPGTWETVWAEEVAVDARGPEGEEGTRPDNVLHLRRRT